jgi:hypothetical protein
VKETLHPMRYITFILLLCLFITPLSGCISDDDYAKAVTQFEQSSDTLIQVYQSLLTNANITEENHFIDSQVFEAKAIDPSSIRNQDLLTSDEIKLRTNAIKALADYTTALATLAAGKPADQIQADTAKASSSLATLSSDATTAIAHFTKGSKTPDYSAPISSAVSAMGEVITLIEKHHGQTEVKESLRKNDPQLKALFDLIGKESTDLYERQKSTLGATGVMLFHDYDTQRQASPINPALLMELSDRIKQYQKDSTLIGNADPAGAIAAFQKSHDALVDAILAPKEKKKESLAQLIAAVKAFAAEVTPLGQDIYAFGKSV